MKRAAALRVLGVSDDLDSNAVRQAYRCVQRRARPPRCRSARAAFPVRGVSLVFEPGARPRSEGAPRPNSHLPTLPSRPRPSRTQKTSPATSSRYVPRALPVRSPDTRPGAASASRERHVRSAPPRKGPSIAHALAPLPHSRQKSRQPRGGAAIQGGGERVRVPDPRGWGGRSGRDLRLPGGHARFCRHVLRVLLRRRLRVMVALRVPRRTRRTRRRQIVPVPPLLHTPRRRRVRLVRLGIYRRGRGRRVWRSERLFHPGTAPGRGRARRRRVVRRRWRVAKRPHPPPR